MESSRNRGWDRRAEFRGAKSCSRERRKSREKENDGGRIKGSRRWARCGKFEQEKAAVDRLPAELTDRTWISTVETHRDSFPRFEILSFFVELSAPLDSN
ncbi:hypothetical protein KM043_009400 [Ampulex compressa]|nr:hypothetical protein KM043_009400 [Ampulex compressa]